jgi:hypothetical protein
MVQEKEGKPGAYAVSRDYMITVTATIPPSGYTYFILK